MNLLELAEKLEIEAQEAEAYASRHIYLGAAVTAPFRQKAADNRKCAAELRAALEEKPLAKQWREEADWNADAAREDLDSGHRNSAMRATGKASAYRQCAADLDAYHDEGRELLRKIVNAYCGEAWLNAELPNLISEAEKYLGGEQ